jgi:uncharacterized short protein YbdD (DUF466 family)
VAVAGFWRGALSALVQFRRGTLSALVKLRRFTHSALARANGDAAYRAYCRHALAHHPERPPLSREDYFNAELRRKWSGVSRCC